MLEKPDIPNSQISSCLLDEYGLDGGQVTFLPLGYDINTAVYRVDAPDGTSYFLKLRKGHFEPITVSLPQFLNRHGVTAIITPLETLHSRLYGALGQYTTILYPFIPGKNGYEVELSDPQWVSLGHAFKMFHSAVVPSHLAQHIPRESYNPHWRDLTRQFLALIDHGTFDEPIAGKLAAFMKMKKKEILHMVDRAQALAQSLREQHTAFVLCHSDAHPGNYLVAETGEVYLVDWDNPCFAPKERDLMCIGGGMSGDQPGGSQESLFYQGYGPVEINQQALAYYRYELIIQDIAEFCKDILLTRAGGEDRAQSYQYFVNSFQPGSVLDAALQTDQRLSLNQ